ncbi:MAG TPA: hypothetical protein VK850_09595, partial [Candidatus Binatia bacterium]|nr:hypothetical protein [Candidatus Binatia bacterium]
MESPERAGRSVPADLLPPENWPPAPQDVYLPENTVHVWRAELLPSPLDVLSADERARAAEFHFDKDRTR